MDLHNSKTVDRESEPDHPVLVAGYDDYSPALSRMLRQCDPAHRYADLFARYHDPRGHGGLIEVLEVDDCIVVGIPFWMYPVKKESRMLMLKGVMMRVLGEDPLAPLLDEDSLRGSKHHMYGNAWLPIGMVCVKSKAHFHLDKHLEVMHRAFFGEDFPCPDISFRGYIGHPDKHALCIVNPYSDTVFLLQEVAELLHRSEPSALMCMLRDYIVMYAISYYMAFDKTRFHLDEEKMYRLFTRHPWWRMMTITVQNSFRMAPPMDIFKAEEFDEGPTYPDTDLPDEGQFWYGVLPANDPGRLSAWVEGAEQERVDKAQASLFMSRFGVYHDRRYLSGRWRVEYRSLERGRVECRSLEGRAVEYRLPEKRSERMLDGGPCGIYPPGCRRGYYAEHSGRGDDGMRPGDSSEKDEGRETLRQPGFLGT